MFVTSVEYLVGNQGVMGSLYAMVGSPDSIVYSISDVGKAGRFSILIGHVIYVY
jgi:hypothetical protein